MTNSNPKIATPPLEASIAISMVYPYRYRNFLFCLIQIVLKISMCCYVNKSTICKRFISVIIFKLLFIIYIYIYFAILDGVDLMVQDWSSYKLSLSLVYTILRFFVNYLNGYRKESRKQLLYSMLCDMYWYNYR